MVIAGPVRSSLSLKERGLLMRYLPDGEQMKKADQYTIQQIGVPSVVLMERAALKIVEVLEEKKKDLRRPLIVCGSGNNGGDGFAVARLLAEKGCHVDVLFTGRESSMTEECRLQAQIDKNLGINLFTEIPEKEYTVIIDAIFGVGLCREVAGHYRDVIGWMNRQTAQKVAVDIPSGICSATGKVLGIAFQAELTVSMACQKRGCALYPGQICAGEVVPVTIGIDPEYFFEQKSVCMTYDKKELGNLLPERKEDSHKGSFGRVLMITGSPGMAGAAYLSATAAYTVGAGLVQIYTAEENRQVLQGLLPEAIISCYREYDEEKLDQLIGWADVICIGCGLGQSSRSEKILLHTIEKAKCPCVIDADGLNLLAGRKDLYKKLGKNMILTPHMKEMSRLTGISVSEIVERRFEVLHRFTKESPCICVLKDSRTIVAQKDRQNFLNLAGNAAMAKGGSGDVLAGVITGLLAQGMDGFQSAVTGVFLHACGGDEARDKKGGYSVLARDLIHGIQVAMKKAKECN